MKRRNRAKRKRATNEKFSFAQLEPRKLLAADGLFSASMSADFIGPMFIESNELTCVVQAEAPVESTQVESDKVESDKVEPGEVKTVDSKDAVEPQTCAAEEPEIRKSTTEQINNRIVGEFQVLGVGDAITWTRYDLYDSADGSFSPGSLEFNYNVSDADALRNVAARETTAAPLEIAQREGLTVYAFDVTGSRVFVNNNNETGSIRLEKPVELEVEEGVFFNEKATESEPAARSATQIQKESSPEVGMLAQRQLFALISPDEFARASEPASATARAVAPGSSLHSLATAAQTSSVPGVQIGDFNTNSNPIPGPQSLPSVNVTNPLILKTRSTGEATPVRSHSADGIVRQATFSRSPGVLPYALIDQWFGRRGSKSQQPSGDTPTVQEGKATDESTSSDSLARGVQIVESAIILIGLPSSRVCRDDGARDRSCR